MADRRLSAPENAAGEFFVDSTCIDCDTCRQLAPEVFADAGDHSYVAAQPAGATAERRAFHALVACPTASIGAGRADAVKQAAGDFPLPVDGEVYYCGYTSPHSYGASSYFVRHPGNNWLIDAPRFVERLARRLEELGGIGSIFLSHRDDVADAERYARRFGSRRIIHRYELDAQPGAETVLEGAAPVELAPDFLAIPTPGHTRGHCVLLYRNRYLFTGDHLWWSRTQGRLSAGRDVCWYSWREQAESMARLAAYRFEWVLPGHGQRVHMAEDEARRQVAALAARMRLRAGAA